MSPHQCSSDRELAQRRNTHKFSRLRSHCQEPSNSEAAWLKASSRCSAVSQYLEKHRTSTKPQVPTFAPVALVYASQKERRRGSEALGEVGSKPRDVKSQMRFSGLEKCICLWLSSCVYLWKAIETQEYFPKIKRALRQHSRQGHSRGTHAQRHFKGLD